MSFPRLITSSRATKLSPEAGDKTSEKPQLDAWRKKSSLLQSEVKIVNGVKLKAKNRPICCWNFSKLYFPQDCDSKKSDNSQDLHECDNVQDDFLRAVLLHVS